MAIMPFIWPRVMRTFSPSPPRRPPTPSQTPRPMLHISRALRGSCRVNRVAGPLPRSAVFPPAGRRGAFLAGGDRLREVGAGLLGEVELRLDREGQRLLRVPPEHAPVLLEGALLVAAAAL